MIRAGREEKGSGAPTVQRQTSLSRGEDSRGESGIGLHEVARSFGQSWT